MTAVRRLACATTLVLGLVAGPAVGAAHAADRSASVPSVAAVVTGPVGPFGWWCRLTHMC